MGLALWVYQKVHNASIHSCAVRVMKIGLKNLLSLSKWISVAFIFQLHPDYGGGMLKSSSVDFAFSFVTKECTQKVLGVTENV